MGNNILIVDDAAFMRMMVKDILTKGGYNVVGEAENGVVAVQKYAELKPDLVTLDITMPEMDGIQALKKIKEADAGANVIMCSAMGQQAMVIEGIAISEGLWASEKDYNAGLKKVATSMGYKSVDELESYFTQYQAYYGQVIIKESVAFNEAVNQLIADNAKILEGSRPADETTTEETTAE